MAVTSSPINWIYFPASTVIVVSIFIGSLLSPLTLVLEYHAGIAILTADADENDADLIAS